MSWQAQLEASLALVGEADSKLFLIEVSDPADASVLDPLLAKTGRPWLFLYGIRGLPLAPPDTRFIITPISSGDIDWLNGNRPLFNERELVVLFVAETEMAARFSHEAPDIYSWVAAKIDLPSQSAGFERVKAAIAHWPSAADYAALAFALAMRSQLPSAKTVFNAGMPYLLGICNRLTRNDPRNEMVVAALAPIIKPETALDLAFQAGLHMGANASSRSLSKGVELLCEAIGPAIGEAFRLGRNTGHSASPT